MNLYEKVGTTEPGKFAHMLGELLYRHGRALNGGELITKKLHCPDELGTWHQQLTALRHYLEKLAHEQLVKEAKDSHEWVSELAKLEKEASPSGETEGDDAENDYGNGIGGG